jgi:ubiquinone/menaquinone biosynthesis C-methylase UbiE
MQETHDHTTGRHMHSGPGHDLLANAFFAGRRRRVYGRLAALSGVGPGDRALDVGCGDGYLTRLLAPLVTSTGAVHGIDPSAEAIARARTISHPGFCSYAQSSALAIDAPDATYDVVVSTLTMHHLDEQDRPTAVQEMLRVLRPGGQLLLAEFRPPRNPLLQRAIRPITSSPMLNNRPELLEDIATQAGFTRASSGVLRPWISYLRACAPS